VHQPAVVLKTKKAKGRASAGLVTENRRAARDHSIEWTIECGMELVGSEVKSLRAGQASISDAYAIVKNGQLYLVGLKITRFRNQSTHTKPDEGRTRRLLAKKDEIEALHEAASIKGANLIPMRIYFKGPWAKVLIGVGKGKTFEDKREDIMKREALRDMARAITRLAQKRRA
jgi:SsrA-binding protein